MDDRPLAAGEVVVLHSLVQNPDAVIPAYAFTWRLEREGLLTPTAHGRLAVTDRGREALARALTSSPRLNADTVFALSAIYRADRDGLIGCWPGQRSGLEAARLFGLIRSEPANAGEVQRATWQLTEAGTRELERLRAAWRAATPMSRAQARVVRAVAIGQPNPVAADRSYTSCHNRGWLAWVPASGRTAGPRREVTPNGWKALTRYHRREKVPLHLPVRALVPGHVVRLAHRITSVNGPVRVVRITPVITSGSVVGYVVVADEQVGRDPDPYPDKRPLPPSATVEVVDHQQ